MTKRLDQLKRRPNLTDEQKAAVTAKRELGWTVDRIAAEFDISSGSVAWCCLVLGADPPDAKLQNRDHYPMVVMRNGMPVRRFTPEDDAQLLRLEAAGESINSIASTIGRRTNSVRGRLSTLARRERFAEKARGIEA